MDPIKEFKKEVQCNIDNMGKQKDLVDLSRKWIEDTAPYKYSYNFTWMGRPIIQFPQDMIAMQEIIWNIKPDLIIETGIAHGGSIIFYASMLQLIGGDGQVLGIDIDIRKHNRIKIERHPMAKRISMIEGSSIDKNVIDKVRGFCKHKKKILVVLDSNHTHEHVLEELKLYSTLISKDSYLIVFDSIIEEMPDYLYSNRPWSKGNNPKTAVLEFLKSNDRFVIDKSIEDKLLITVAPSGYLRCVKDIDE